MGWEWVSNGSEIGSNWAVAATYLGLLAFGAGYNYVVARLNQKGYSKGFTAILVVGGTLITLLAMIPIVGWAIFFLVLGAFAASGLPMVLGDIYRYVKERDDATEKLRQLNDSP